MTGHRKTEKEEKIEKSGRMCEERKTARPGQRERRGMRGPVSVSLQFRAARCAGVPGHLHMNQDQRRAPRIPKRVCGGHDTRTNNRSQLCKSRLRWRDVLGTREKKTRKEQRPKKRRGRSASRLTRSGSSGLGEIPDDPGDSYGNERVEIRGLGLTDFRAGSRRRVADQAESQTANAFTG